MSQVAWIPVTERLPEFGEEVIVSYLHRFGDRTVGTLYFWGTTMSAYWMDVTHWMPFPEPAEGTS